MTDTTAKRSLPKKPTPLEAFEMNMADAVWMVELAEALDNRRKRAPYKPTREKLGAALKLGKADQDGMDIVESDDFVVIIKRGSDFTRESLEDRTVLLRHAVVAACAATETYFADKVIEIVRPMLHTTSTAKTPLPKKLRDVPLTVGDMVALDHDYKLIRAGLTKRVLIPYIERQSSVDPAALGEIITFTPVKNFFAAVDNHLGWEKGNCHARMTAIAKRRNVIAHTGDRLGRGRATLELDDARGITDDLIAIVTAAEKILTPPPPAPKPDRAMAVHTALTRCSEPVSAAELAELCGVPKTTVTNLLAKWSHDDFDDDRFPGVERVARGRYLYQP